MWIKPEIQNPCRVCHLRNDAVWYYTKTYNNCNDWTQANTHIFSKLVSIEISYIHSIFEHDIMWKPIALLLWYQCLASRKKYTPSPSLAGSQRWNRTSWSWTISKYVVQSWSVQYSANSAAQTCACDAPSHTGDANALHSWHVQGQRNQLQCWKSMLDSSSPQCDMIRLKPIFKSTHWTV